MWFIYYPWLRESRSILIHISHTDVVSVSGLDLYFDFFLFWMRQLVRWWIAGIWRYAYITYTHTHTLDSCVMQKLASAYTKWNVHLALVRSRAVWLQFDLYAKDEIYKISSLDDWRFVIRCRDSFAVAIASVVVIAVCW